MLIRRIQQFVDELSQFIPLSDADMHWLKEFKSQFIECCPDSQLSKEHEAWILSSYTLRVQKLYEISSHKLPAHASKIDKIWLDLAIEVADQSTQFYLSDNDKTLHSVDDLLGQVKPESLTAQETALSFTFKEKSKPPLSIKELFRLKNKQGCFEVAEESYTNAWDYLCKKVAPSWHDNKGSISSLSFELITLITHYQTQGDHHVFKGKLKELNSNLINLSFEEVNCFYSLSFEFCGHTMYLFEFLVDCWADVQDLDLKFIEVARWLSEENPAWISSNLLVQPMYEQMEVGPYFSLSKLRQLVGELILDDGLVVQEAFLSLNKMLLMQTEITPQMIKELGIMYQLRWTQLRDKDHDYFFAPRSTTNQSWIKLAESLAGAGLIDSNYYRFLIPTLEQNVNKVSDVPITTYPLNAYILSEDEKQLIYLPHSYMHYKSKGTFYNCNDPEKPTPLTAKEKKRLFRVVPDSLNYFKRTDSKKTISKQTVEKIKQLVIDSLYLEGLNSGVEYDSTQSMKAEIAYTVFYYQYLKALQLASPEEYANLCAHTIQLNDTCLTVESVLKHVMDDKECVATNGKYFLKLVLDYQPDTTFVRPTIGLSGLFNDYSLDYFVERYGLRLQSARLIYQDVALCHEEALRCLMTLLISLMTHPFSVVYATGTKISAMGFSNWTTSTGKKIFDAIWPLLVSGHLKSACSIYMSIMETIIDPAINDKSYKAALMRYSDTCSWLVSIKNQELFKAENAIYFPLEKIFYVLLALWGQEKNEAKKCLLGECIDELLKLEQPVVPGGVSSDNVYQVDLEMNVKLINFINQPNSVIIKQDVMTALRSNSDLKTLNSKGIEEDVMVRFAGSTGVGRFMSFFSKSAASCNLLDGQLILKESDPIVSYV